MNCKQCGLEITELIAFCPFCGAVQAPSPIAPADPAALSPPWSRGGPLLAAPEGSGALPLEIKPRANSGLAIAALIMGLLSSCSYGLLGVAAIICGRLALRQIKSSEGRLTGREMAISGVVIGVLSIAIYGASLLWALIDGLL